MEPTANDSSGEPRVGEGFACVSLPALPDMAPQFGYGEMGESRFAAEQLGCERTGISYQCLNPGRRQAFAHRHTQAEETYVVLSGSGRICIGDTTLELAPLDAVRVAPSAMRAFEAGPDGMRLLAFGTRHPDDFEVAHGWWGD